MTSKSLLKNKSIRLTPFRLAVLEVFQKHANAIGLTDIEKEIGEHDRITLYRTLKTFTEKGVIHEIAMPGEEKKMALCESDCKVHDHNHQHEHIHFQCKSCNEIYCVDVHPFPSVQLKNFSIDSLEITAKGQCEHCLN